MKKVLFIGNRMNVLKHIENFADLELIKIYIQEDSLLAQEIDKIPSAATVEKRYFNLKEKHEILKDILSNTFDILISNGCPFILPISDMRRNGQLFINIHPTLLPELKGKTPLNGVFLTHQKKIGATMHYMDDGIDTGATIAQSKVDLSDDIDQGLVYKISFDLESNAFIEGMKLLQENSYKYSGQRQNAEGSYFNRTEELQTINFDDDSTDLIIDKIKSFNIKGQGTTIVTNEDIYKVYLAEKIVNEYLLNKYSNTAKAKVAFRYDDKIVLKTKDGMIKLIDYEINNQTK